MPPEADATASETSVEKPPSVGDSPPAPKPADPDQERWEKIIQARVAETERSVRRKLLEDAGVGTLEELKSTLKAAKDASDKNKSELERAIAEARAETEAARLEREAAARERHAVRVERALAAAGAGEHAPDLAKLVDVEHDAEYSEVEGAVELLKQRLAPLFGRPTVTPSASEPSGGGPSLRPSNSPDAESLGRQRAERLNEQQAGRRPSFL